MNVPGIGMMAAADTPREVHKIFNVAIVGCGGVAMTTHLPTLLLHAHMFRTVALMDVSKKAVDHCAAKYHVSKTFTDLTQMLKSCPEVDVVMILSANEYHVSQTIECLQAGKHVFLEKPIALTKGGADEMEAARVAAGDRQVFVGYMRRYATAYKELKKLVKQLPQINYVHVRDIIGSNTFFVDQSGTYPELFDDVPPEASAECRALNERMLREAIGVKYDDPIKRRVWMLLNGLASHDISAMRELIGMPQKVLSAWHSPNGLFMTMTFQYDGFVAYYECAIDGVRQFDAHIEVYSQNTHLRVDYETPFVKGLPITLRKLSSTPEGYHSEEVIRPTYEDAYTLEYRALHNAITTGVPAKTTLLDAKQDLEIFEMVMAAM